MNLNDFKKQYDQLSIKKNLKGKQALEAVKQDGYSLRYVKEQTPEICLEAVKQNGDALRYVNEDMFNSFTTAEDKLNKIKDILNS